MQVIIKIGGRWKDDRRAYKLFRLHTKRVKTTMKRLSKTFRFRPPKQIILRPLYYKGNLGACYGRAIYDPFSGYSIAINITACQNMLDKGLWVVDHECAHIAANIKHKDFGHGERFQRFYAACKRR